MANASLALPWLWLALVLVPAVDRASAIPTASPREDLGARYIARHQVYTEDVRGRAFYRRIVGNGGHRQAGSVQDAQKMQPCGSVPADAGEHLAMIQSGRW